MPDLATITGLSPDALSHLQDIPDQVEQLVTTTQQILTGIRDGTATDNPVGSLFSSLSSIASDAGAIPGIGDLVTQVESALQGLPDSALADVEEVGRAVEGVLGLFGPLRDAVASGGLESAVEQAMGKALDSLSNLTGPEGDVGAVLGELDEFFRLFEALVGWESSPPSPEAVVDLLARALVGAPADLLKAPADALDRALAPLGSILPEGPDLATWRGIGDRLKTAFDDLAARAGGAVVWADLEVAVGRIRGQLQDAAAARDRMGPVVVSAAGTLDLSGLSAVASALHDVPTIAPLQLSPILEGLRTQLQSIVADLEAFVPTPDQLRSSAREFMGRFVDFVNGSPIGQLRVMLVNAQERLLREIESLPFADIANEAKTALARVAESFDLIDPDAVRQPVQEFFDGLRDRLGELSGDAIKGALQQVWQQVEDVVNQVAGLVQEATTALTDAVGHLTGFVNDAAGALEQLGEQVDQVKATIEGFDLQPAADAVVDAFHELRDKVADLHVEELPAPARAPLQAAAETVRSIDVTAQVSPPLDQVLGQLDPAEAIQAISGPLGQFVDDLKTVDPAALAQRLDAPVDDVLSALGQFGPDQFTGLVLRALEPVKDAVRSIDAAEILEPVLQIAAELTAKVNSILDPDVVFQPLEQLFQPVIDLIDAIAPARLVALLEPHASAAGQGVAAAGGPPSAIASAGGLLQSAIPDAAEAADELFGYRPGDLLIPLIDLHRKLMATFDHVADEVLDPAGELLAEAMFGRLQSLHPVSVEVRIGAGLDAVLGEFDGAAVAARLQAASDGFVAASAAVGAAAAGSLSSSDRAVADRVVAGVPALDPLQLVPALEGVDPIRQALRTAADAVDLVEVRLGFAAVGPGLDDVLPALFRSASLDAAAIRKALADLDPSPIRQDVNDLFDQVGQRVVGLSEALLGAIDEMGKVIEDFLVPVTPAHLIGLASQLHTALKEQLLRLGPAGLKEAVRPLFDTVKRQLSVIDPSFLVGDLNGLRDQVIASIDGLAAGFVPDRAPFDELQTRVAGLKPSRLLQPLVDELKPVTDFIAKLDPAAILQPIADAFVRIRAQLPDLLREIEDAIDEVLAALEGGDAGGGSAGGSVGVG